MFKKLCARPKAVRLCSSNAWEQRMPNSQFDLMKRILAAPSPVGLEAAMIHGVLAPHFESFMPPSWKMHTFQGSAGAVWDSAPGDEDKLKVMVMGHADKIRMQVRHIAKDGKIYINSDSFLPLSLLGNRVILYSQDPSSHGGGYRQFTATVEAVGAIHFADADVRSGKKGIKAEQLYLELGLHGKDRQDQVKALGVCPGDPVLMDRPIERCVGEDTFSGAYLDNGLGCFVTAELARRAVEHKGGALLDRVRLLSAVSSHEEIGRFGSRVLAGSLRPDVLIAVDVNHDYEAAPNRSSQRDCPLTMGEGMTMCVGAIASTQLNGIIARAARARDINVQCDVRGRDTGTDGMAGVLASIDCAATSVGFPIRNMHTTSELAHTGDVLACTEALLGTLELLAEEEPDFRSGHPRLDLI